MWGEGAGWTGGEASTWAAAWLWMSSGDSVGSSCGCVVNGYFLLVFHPLGYIGFGGPDPFDFPAGLRRSLAGMRCSLKMRSPLKMFWTWETDS